MNPTHKTLPCSVFGHNYVKSKINGDNTTELTCCHCNTKVQTDVKGNFETASISNVQIQSALRQLFHLNLRALKPTYSQ